MPSSFLLRWMTSASFVLTILARCERPTAAFVRASRLQPGCLAHGPEEKQGFFGVRVGFILVGTLMIPNRLRCGHKRRRCKQAAKSEMRFRRSTRIGVIIDVIQVCISALTRADPERV